LEYKGSGWPYAEEAYSVTNCLFIHNDGYSGPGADSGAGLEIKHSMAEVTNCTFANNEGMYYGRAGGLNSTSSTVTITNSIFSNNAYGDISGDGLTVSYCDISDADNWPEDNQKHIINDDPLFLDAANGDFRLDPASPCIDRGTTIASLFSDIRGSIRPVDGPVDGQNDGVAKFDLGAYEYSEYYGGISGDLPAKAFKELGIESSLAVTGFEYLIEWNDKNPFPSDPRVVQTGEYTVNIALVNDYGHRIELGTYTVAVTQQGYSIPFTFSPEHIGCWRIRVELASDPSQFELSDEICIQYKEPIQCALGQRIEPPKGADPNQKPDVEHEKGVYWSVETNRLYAVAPMTTVVTWYADEQREIPVPVVVYITYPDRDNRPDDPHTQIHIADSMPVDLMPEGTRFDMADMMYTDNDATISENKFTATREGWSVLLYRDDQADDPDEKEKFDVVRTYLWNRIQDRDKAPHSTLNPAFPAEATWNIGEKITDGEHNSDCGCGYIFFEGAHYDGYGERKAYDREARRGAIFAVNKDDPATEEDDLVVVWYKTSSASGVCWPSKPVRYDAQWPQVEQIVIASQLGSGLLDPGTYGRVENMMVYNQPDPELPGYNPNEEHAEFFTGQGSSLPAVFALRTDLNGTDWNDPLRRYTSEPYVLLKYTDPLSGAWNFKVFEVVAQSKSHIRRSGDGMVITDVVGIGTRYFLDVDGALVERSGYLPDDSYYIDADGHLRNPADPEQILYNYTGGTIAKAEGAPLKHYIDESGQLSTDVNPYSLDIHGVLVESDVYYRFHYSRFAGMEINPPYPLNKLTFGPCAQSYIHPDSENSVLKDKDDKFFARHGGINDNPTSDIVVKYFYKLQTGFWYDPDGDGVPDETVGTPVPWLEGLAETGTQDPGDPDKPIPVDTTYAVSWPDPVPTLYVGETLTEAKTQEGESVGLPDVAGRCIVEVLFDQAIAEAEDPDEATPSAKLIDPIAEHSVSLALENGPEADLSELEPKLSNNRYIFKALPYHLQSRLTYDVVTEELKLKGIYATGTGEPLLLLNTLTERDIMEISRPFMPDPGSLDPATWEPGTITHAGFRTALYHLKSVGDTALEGASMLKFAEMKALTAGSAGGARLETADAGKQTGYYVTLAFNNDPDDCTGSVELAVIKVDSPLYRGQIKVIESDDAFEEKVTLRHNGDFGGKSDTRWFQWKYSPADFPGQPVGPGTPGENWYDYTNALQAPGEDNKQQLEELDGDLDTDLNPNGLVFKGAEDVIVQGTGQQLLSDKWFSVRYYHDGIGDELSRWTEPQLYEGWIKRVMKDINLFDQKVKDFREGEVDTLGSMISLAGEKYEGDVALNADPDNLNDLGIIEIYQTLLERAKDLSINQGLDDTASNQAILFAASRLAGLYMLLGNEAYADAADPTIGFSTADGHYGSEAPSIFCFQNQVASLLDEELVLLRGRDDDGMKPFYNRMVWNFTLGEGEVAYKESYNITDQNGDGEINELDAMIQFPQGHGDAWGHYTTAIKYYYDLLRHPYFTWEPQAENILVDQAAVAVDYLDERKFAAAAAAKARTGAEIVNLTYRQHYTEDPEGQWQGYKDPDTARAWGVDGWARRSGQGAYFDWVVGNAILPAEDGENEGIEKIDRTTVVELREIASRYDDTQAQVDQVDVGLNPLGVAKGSVPFDIKPREIDNGQTHFEQIYKRAVDAMNNAIAVFNHANQSTQLLRRQQDSLADFRRNIDNTTADFNNRLVEVYGYPYPGDCGPGKTYSTQECNTSPDLYHYMYVDPSELMGVDAPKTYEFPVTFKNIGVDATGALQEEEQEVVFHVATDNRFGLIKPEEWIGRRKAPGEIQLARSDLLQSRGRFENALKEYDNLLRHIEEQADLIAAQHGLNAEEIKILNAAKATQENLNSRIKGSRTKQLLFRKMGSSAVLAANALAEGFPSVVGFIAGTSSGAIADVTALTRAGMKNIGMAINEIMTGMADLESLSELDHHQAKEIASAEVNIKLTALRGGFAVEQQLLQLENLIRTEVPLRYEIYNLAEGMQQTADRYLSALAKGERLLADQLRFNRQTAVKIQDYRYKDMTFRIFRNDALEKYRAQFDMAARYVYLAAKAYDYETMLLDFDTMAGQAFLTDIVKQRTIGMISDGEPLTGSGLADPMKRMGQNFVGIKGQLGFDTPQVEANRFSLRKEMFRIKMDQESSENWRDALRAHVVDDLWKVAEFRRYCRPFAPEGVAQPAIVIPFSTTVTAGLNFFRWPKGGGDSSYSSANYATKVRSVGVWFSNYSQVGLPVTPRVYLIPAGEDILRTPYLNIMEIRSWHVVDQKLPEPFALNISEVARNSNWIPTVNTISDEMFEIRRHSDFRAYHDGGSMNPSEMKYDSRLVGRSVWNSNWVLIIPGITLSDDAEEGIDTFIDGPRTVGGTGERNGHGISDIMLFFMTYAYSGN
jgi:hypothetical protein